MSSGEFSGKVAIVTGGTQGIGRAIAEALGQRGAWVALLARDPQRGQAAEQALEPDCKFYPADVTDGSRVEQVIKQIYRERGRIDYLVNNAGTTGDNLLVRMSDEQWDLVFEVNLKGAFHCLRAAARYMLKARSGAVVNITSVSGQVGVPGQVNYSAAKAGLIGFTRSAARELAARGIRVNALAPGFFQTELTGRLDEQVKRSYLKEIPLGRFGEIPEVAEVACFLLSERASYITGQVINVDGGLVMA
ncbi:MAG TPA: beta-ketoacyl-ACP reductase [Candidatus Fraserbacteria bacterium]|nr:beta-ketoacyl-ACP reductase [Candidatus Fraserbacteria bacterium]